MKSEPPSPTALPKTKKSFAEVIAARRQAIAGELANTLSSPASLVLEVGCGHGHFLTAYAAAHPDTVCVGVDIDSDRIHRARRKQARERLGNLHFFRGEALLFLQALPPPTKLSDVYILFPDPWPKLRHHKHRIIQTEFLHELEKRMSPTASLYFRTDFQPYFTDARSKLGEQGWNVSEGANWPFESETVFQSRAESFCSLVARHPVRS